MVNEFQLKKLLESPEELNRKIEDYISKYILVKQEVDLEEIKGHIQKAKHNILFSEDTLKQNYTETLSIDVSRLPEGIYFIEARSNSGKSIQKFIKK